MRCGILLLSAMLGAALRCGVVCCAGGKGVMGLEEWKEEKREREEEEEEEEKKKKKKKHNPGINMTLPSAAEQIEIKQNRKDRDR